MVVFHVDNMYALKYSIKRPLNDIAGQQWSARTRIGYGVLHCADQMTMLSKNGNGCFCKVKPCLNWYSDHLNIKLFNINFSSVITRVMVAYDGLRSLTGTLYGSF